MTPLPRTVLADLGVERPTDAPWADGAPWPSVPLQTKLVDPWHAILWVAAGRFCRYEDTYPLISWADALELDLSRSYKEDGKIELATEIIGANIKSGRLRLVFVVPSDCQPRRLNRWEAGYTAARLETVSPQQFAGFGVEFSMDDGPFVGIWKETATDEIGGVEGYHTEFSDFWFFWDEVARLRPGEPEQAPPPLPAIGSAPSQPSRDESDVSGSRKRRRGPRMKDHGAPIASFIANCIAVGLAKSQQEHRDTLGGQLRAAYEAEGQDPPHIDDAGRMAVSALTAWSAQMGQ